MSKGTFVLAAGGTGGHLFPAQALAEELIRRGYAIHLMTDERVRDYGKSFPATETHVVPSATLSLSKPWLVPGRALGTIGLAAIVGAIRDGTDTEHTRLCEALTLDRADATSDSLEQANKAHFAGKTLLDLLDT